MATNMLNNNSEISNPSKLILLHSSNIHQNNILDAAIESYKLLTKQIAELEKQRESLKQQLIATYFHEHTSYTTQNGLLTATYKAHPQEFFSTKQFKEDKPKIYEKYAETRDIFRFLVK